MCPLSRVCPGSPRCEVKDTLGAGTPKALSHELMTVFFSHPSCVLKLNAGYWLCSAPRRRAGRPEHACIELTG